MRRTGVFGSVAAVMFVMAAMMAAAAGAVEVGILTGLPQPFTSKGVGVSKLVTLSGKIIECTALSNKGTTKEKSKTEGEITLTFTGCTTENGKVKCKSGSEAAGTIVFKTLFTIVDIEEASKLLLAILITLKETLLITCGVLKIEVKGSVIGEATKYQETAKEKTEKVFKTVEMPAVGTGKSVSGIEVTDVFAQAGGDQAITKCHLPTGVCEGKTFLLEANFGAGFESAAQESTDELESEGGSLVTIDY